MAGVSPASRRCVAAIATAIDPRSQAAPGGAIAPSLDRRHRLKCRRVLARESHRAMPANLPLLSGGQLVVAALRAHGVDMAFSVAGESYLEVLDALFDAPQIRPVTWRPERV